MPEVVKKRQAKEDLREQAVYLASSSPAIAERFLDAAEKAFTRLADMPGIGAPLQTRNPRLATVRKWPVPGFRNHLIFYRITQHGVDILRVLHGARDLDRLFEEQPFDEPS